MSVTVYFERDVDPKNKNFIYNNKCIYLVGLPVKSLFDCMVTEKQGMGKRDVIKVSHRVVTVRIPDSCESSLCFLQLFFFSVSQSSCCLLLPKYKYYKCFLGWIRNMHVCKVH